MAYYDSTRSALAYAERGMPKLRQDNLETEYYYSIKVDDDDK